MIWTGADWTTVVTGAGVVLAVLSGGAKLWRKVEKADPALTHELPHKVVEIADDVAKFVEGIAKSPLFAAEAAKGKVEVQHVVDKLASTTLAQEIAKVLAAAGKKWADMSEIEKGTLLTTVQAALAKVGVRVTSAQIAAAVPAVEIGIQTLAPIMTEAAERAAAIVQPAQTTA